VKGKEKRKEEIEAEILRYAISTVFLQQQFEGRYP